MTEKQTSTEKKVSAKKTRKTIYHPITEDPYIVEGNNEVDLENKIVKKQREWQDAIEKQAQKEAEEEYKRSGHREAHVKTEEEHNRIIELNSLCFSRLHVISCESFISENVSAEVLPPRRVSYPTLEECQRSARIWLPVRLIHHLFPNTFANLYQLAQQRYDKETEAADKLQEQINQKYDQKKAEKTAEFKSIILHMGNREPEYVCNYFLFALTKDRYNLKRGVLYKPEVIGMDFNPRTGLLSFAYKIPNCTDIDLVESYEYDEKADAFRRHEYSKQEIAEYTIGFADALLLRAVATVFKSDEYDLVSSIQIVGYVDYLDDASGKIVCKAVIIAQVTKAQFNDINLERVNAKAFFDRIIKAQVADGLYSKANYEVDALIWERPE